MNLSLAGILLICFGCLWAVAGVVQFDMGLAQIGRGRRALGAVNCLAAILHVGLALLAVSDLTFVYLGL